MTQFNSKPRSALGMELQKAMRSNRDWENKPQQNRTNNNNNFKAKLRPNPMSWDADGVDHINIGYNVATDLGMALSNSAPLPISHPRLGNFRSIECLWYWMTREGHDDRLRSHLGKSLYRLANSFEQIQRVPNFRAMIVDSLWLKVQQHPTLLEELKASTLPFDYYNIQGEGGPRVRRSFANWVLDGIDEVRAALKEDRLPNLKPFLDDKNIQDTAHIYDEFLKMMADEYKSDILGESDQDEQVENESVQTYQEPVQEQQ